MPDLTVTQLAILIIICIVIAFLVLRLLHVGIRVFIAVGLIIVLFGIGYYWLPKQVDKVTSGEETVTDIIKDTVNDFENSGITESIEQGYNDIKEGWDNFWSEY